jgi:hypothetical protein
MCMSSRIVLLTSSNPTNIQWGSIFSRYQFHKSSLSTLAMLHSIDADPRASHSLEKCNKTSPVTSLKVSLKSRQISFERCCLRDVVAWCRVSLLPSLAPHLEVLNQ